MKSKFGKLSLNNQGYYIVTSSKEGNSLKRFHRLVWENFYGCKVPDGFVIHHKNGNKTDNCIMNLQLMRNNEHRKHHTMGEGNPMYGHSHSEESKLKISENRKGIPAWNKGVSHSAEAKRKMSENHADFKGNNHPRSKYRMWDNSIVHYNKSTMFKKGNEDGLNPRKCFSYKFEGYNVPIGGFNEFISIEIIDNIVRDEMEVVE